MFQYAAGTAIAFKHNQLLLLDLKDFDGYPLHNGFELDRIFNVEYREVTFHELKKLLWIANFSYLIRIFKHRFLKPIKPRVFISRIKALLRRYAPEQQKLSQIDLGNIKIDNEKYCVYKDDQEIAFPKKEFKLLSLLASKPGKVFTREFILEQVWGDEVIVGDRTIDVHIRKLREKLGEDYIKTIKGIGYKFEF